MEDQNVEKDREEIFDEPRPEGSRLAAALAQARPKFRPLKRTKTVTVSPREGRSYSYSYATLADVLECCVEALGAEGLSLSSRIESAADGTMISCCELLHASGEVRQSKMTLPRVIKMQELGSALTYSTRYQYSLLLALAADEDDDGSSADGVHGASIAPKGKGKPAAKPAPQGEAEPLPPTLAPEAQAPEAPEGDDPPVTPSQAEAFIKAARSAGMKTAQARDLMTRITGATHSSEIPSSRYAALMQAVIDTVKP